MNKNISFYKKNHGVSLVSLLIGVSLSAFLITVLLQVFSSSRSNYNVANNIVELDDAMNFVISTLTDIIPNAAYRSPASSQDPLAPLNTALPGNNNIPNSLAGLYVMPYASANGKDGFTIVYTGNSDGSIKDCHGTPVGVNGDPNLAYLTFQQVALAGKNNSMLCQRYGANKTTEIISNVLDQFWVRYGVVNNDGQIEKYLTAADNPDYTKVRTIQLAILLHSPTEVYPKDTLFSFYKWGEVITKNDKYLYKFLTLTFPLPNVPDQIVKNASGGNWLADTSAQTSWLPTNYKPASGYLNNFTFNGNTISYPADQAAGTATVFVYPFVDVNSVNANKEVYVEYHIANYGQGNETYFCYFFQGVTNNNLGDGDSHKVCFKNEAFLQSSDPNKDYRNNSIWYKYDCSSREALASPPENNVRLVNGDTIGMSIRFPTSMSAGQNIVTRLFRNGGEIYSFNSNGSPCQPLWDQAINNKQQIVFTVGNFAVSNGMKTITILNSPLN